MRLALTYNVKHDNGGNADMQSVSANAAKYVNRDLVENYPERLDDTYAEWDSMETIDAVKSALVSENHEVELVEANDDSYFKLKELKPDFVFNVAEGFYGASRESQIPSMLEMLNIPFTGSDSITIGICHDKSRCKEILSYYNIPNSKFFITDTPVKSGSDLNFPKFVKPLHEGSSKGIYNSSVVNSVEELNSEIERVKSCYGQPALVEDYITGKEFTVAMLGNGNDVRVLPIVEINLDTVPEGFNKIYSYEVKWFFDTRENQLDIFRCPAEIDRKIYSHIEKVCKDAFRVLRIRDWARIDIRLDGNNVPNVIEINPLPGILPDPADNSCYPKAARNVGMDYNKMINAVLHEAVKRNSGN
ncbi:MAG: ATP-grasp domain-containing protein [Ignavibacteria bacterium]|nr:ATP-grasp domain-containing protein [Ignavibacteria bacterium]